MRIFLMGGSGNVGSRLIAKMSDRNDEVVLLTRRPDAVKEKFGDACEVVAGNPTEAGEWMDAVQHCDAVINLTGEGVFNKRWNDEFKQLMYDSRIKSTENAVKALEKKPKSDSGQAKVLVNASAIGYYGFHGDEEIDEKASPGDDYLAKLCVDWENAAKPAEKLGVRLAIIRIGVVLDEAGGALKQLLRPFKMFVGGPVATGKQYVSWIHHADQVGIILLALDNAEATGPINGTSPNPVTNKELSTTLGGVLGKPSFMPTPGFGLKLALGPVADLVIQGQRVPPRRAQELGYAFQFADLEGALKDILA